jgi:hypothetical protein
MSNYSSSPKRFRSPLTTQTSPTPSTTKSPSPDRGGWMSWIWGSPATASPEPASLEEAILQKNKLAVDKFIKEGKSIRLYKWIEIVRNANKSQLKFISEMLEPVRITDIFKGGISNGIDWSTDPKLGVHFYDYLVAYQIKKLSDQDWLNLFYFAAGINTEVLDMLLYDPETFREYKKSQGPKIMFKAIDDALHQAAFKGNFPSMKLLLDWIHKRPTGVYEFNYVDVLSSAQSNPNNKPMANYLYDLIKAEEYYGDLVYPATGNKKMSYDIFKKWSNYEI